MNTSQGVWKSHLFYNGDAIADSIYLQFFIEFQILIFFQFILMQLHTLVSVYNVTKLVIICS